MIEYSDRMVGNPIGQQAEMPYTQLQNVYPDKSWDEQFESEMKKSFKVLLEDDFVVNKLKNFSVWSLVTKTSKITFLEKYELPIFESHLESMLCSEMMSHPPCMVNDEVCQLADQARMISRLNLRRSSGTDNINKLNERTVQATQIRQSLSSGGMGTSTSRPGFLKRMFGMR